jgi:hypothetical protein
MLATSRAKTLFTYWVDICVEIVKVHKQVNSSISKGFHAPLMITLGINMVNSDSICAQVFHLIGIECTLCGIDKRIVRDQLIRDALGVLAADEIKMALKSYL